MKWRKRKEARPLPSWISRTLTFINQAVRRWADCLQQRTNGLSHTRLKWMLYLFCALYTGSSIYVIVTSLRPGNKKPFIVTPIHVLPLVKETNRPPILTPKELYNIHQFNEYLDSLNHTKNGKALWDSFLLQRPHLLDTLSYLEQLYQQNKQK